MKTKDIPSLKQKVLNMVPITQAEVWKTLGIGHRDGSTLVNIMLCENLITKRKLNNTFLLERRNGERRKDDRPKYSSLLSARGSFSPCCGCNIECEPYQCDLLVEWVK